MNERILVTGGNGFLGRAVCKELKSRGYTGVTTFSRDDLDLRVQDDVYHYLYRYTPKKVIHLAATVGGIGANKDRPGEFFYDNMVMGVNLIEACRLYNVEKFVLISTVCSYPNDTQIPFKEKNIWNGYPEPTNAPYGIAKRALMEMLQAYRKQYGFNGITLIPVNLYGPGDNFHPYNSHVIAGLLNKFWEAIQHSPNKDVVVWGTGNASREFLYVEDAAKGIVDALERYNEPDPVNLGTGQEITIRDLVNQIAKIMDFNGNIIFDSSQPDGQMRRCLDVNKALLKFGFEAKTTFEEGLYKTIDW